MPRITGTHAYLSIIVATVTLHSLVIANDGPPRTTVTRNSRDVSTTDYPTQPISPSIHQAIGEARLGRVDSDPHDGIVLSGLEHSRPIRDWLVRDERKAIDPNRPKSLPQNPMKVPPVYTPAKAQTADISRTTTERTKTERTGWPEIPIAPNPTRPGITVVRGSDPIVRSITSTTTQPWPVVARDITGEEPSFPATEPIFPETTATVEPEQVVNEKVVGDQSVLGIRPPVEPRLASSGVREVGEKAVVAAEGFTDARGAADADEVERVNSIDAPIADQALFNNEPIVRSIVPFPGATSPLSVDPQVVAEPRTGVEPQTVVVPQADTAPQVVTAPQFDIEPQVAVEQQMVVNGRPRLYQKLFPLPGFEADASAEEVGKATDVEANASAHRTDVETPLVTPSAPSPSVSVVRQAEQLNAENRAAHRTAGPSERCRSHRRSQRFRSRRRSKGRFGLPQAATTEAAGHVLKPARSGRHDVRTAHPLRTRPGGPRRVTVGEAGVYRCFESHQPGLGPRLC